jgi:2-polyprenyl-6-methoxyphenol hydroxylase-like FAD-dependent oxidoreductase
MFCRRPIFEWVLWEAAMRESNIELLDDTAVAELLFTSDDRPPRVRGVRTRTGVVLESDLVIDASGRRSRVRSMLHDAGVHMPDERTGECGMVYYARYFERFPRSREIEGKWLFGPRIELPYGMVMVHLADARTFSVTFTVPAWDAELRALKDENAWMAAVTAMPGMRAWIDGDVAMPVSEVLGMGGLRNVLRPFVAADGSPVVLGVLPVGDALCHTNAAYGWGASLGIAQAFAVVDALDAHGDDADALVRDYHARVWPTAESRYRASLEQDTLRTSMWRGDPPATGGVAYGARMRELAPAMFTDTRVFRAVVRCAMLLDPPETILDDDALLAHARSVVAGIELPPPPPLPTRDDLLRRMSVAEMMGEIGER